MVITTNKLNKQVINLIGLLLEKLFLQRRLPKSLVKFKLSNRH